MTNQELAELYRAHLSEEGFSPKIDSDGDVIFKFEGRSHFISVNAEDENFFRLIFPNFWPIENEDERKKVNAAALQATAKTKVAKIFPVKDNVCASIEMFCSPPEVFKAVLTRSLNALRAGVENFREGMQD